MVHRNTGQIEHRVFRDIGDYLRPGDLLVANDSRVIPARLHGRKASGSQVEIFLLHPLPEGRWECLVGGKRLRPGVSVTLETPAAVQPPVVATIEAELPAGSRVGRLQPAG